MVDDRYGWLDEETAEQLLRGLPVDARCDGQEARLGEALRTLRPTAPAAEGGELAGEAAAMEAFRAGRPAAAGAKPLPPTLLGRVSAVCRPPVRSAGRPLRAGLAVALAGFALGGVAVAAGAGVLPTPFHEGPTGPAVSVSPMNSPSPGDAGGTDGSSKRPGASAGTTPGGSPDAAPGATPTPDGGRHGSDERRHRNGHDGRRHHSGGHGPQLSEVDQEALVDTLCSAYTHDELNVVERGRLERAAGGEEAVRTFCADHGVTAGDDTASGRGGHRGEDETLSGGSDTAGTDAGGSDAGGSDAGGTQPGDGGVVGGALPGGGGGLAGGAAGGVHGTDHHGGRTAGGTDGTGDTDGSDGTNDTDGTGAEPGTDTDGQEPSDGPSGSPAPTPSASAHH